MNSELFKSIGIDSIDPGYYIIGLLGLIIILLIVIIVMGNNIGKLKKKYNKFLQGKSASNLEDSIFARFDDVDKMKVKGKERDSLIQKNTDNLKIAFQRVGIVKYDAFNEMGGDLSFSLVLLDARNTGFVINAMHSREGCYTYIKEIIEGESAIALGTEEKKALDKAMGIEE